jgi:hypothetical protein
VTASPQACDPSDQDQEHQFYHTQLRNLGFEPLGVVELIVYWFCSHYRKPFRKYVFVQRELGVYACVYRLFPGDELRFALFTLLEDDWLIETASCLDSLIETREKYYRWGVTNRLIQEQLQAHLDLLRSRWEEGDVIAPINLGRLAERMRQENEYSSRKLFAGHSWLSLGMASFVIAVPAGLGLVAYALVVLCLGTFFPASTGSSTIWNPLLVPAGLLVGCAIFYPLMNALMQISSQDTRQEDLEKRAIALLDEAQPTTLANRPGPERSNLVLDRRQYPGNQKSPTAISPQPGPVAHEPPA